MGHIFLAIVLGVVGVFSGQRLPAYPKDFSWFGWIAIGTGLTAGAIFVFVALKPERDEHRP